MKRRIDKANNHGLAAHGSQDAMEVAALKREQFVECPLSALSTQSSEVLCEMSCVEGQREMRHIRLDQQRESSHEQRECVQQQRTCVQCGKDQCLLRRNRERPWRLEGCPHWRVHLQRALVGASGLLCEF